MRPTDENARYRMMAGMLEPEPEHRGWARAWRRALLMACAVGGLLLWACTAKAPTDWPTWDLPGGGWCVAYLYETRCPRVMDADGLREWFETRELEHQTKLPPEAAEPKEG